MSMLGMIHTKEARRKQSMAQHRLYVSGLHKGAYKLRPFDVKIIRAFYNQGASIAWLSKQFPRVSDSAVADICNGRSWKHLL